MIDKLKVITLNVRGLHDYIKRRKIFDWLRDQNNNIIFLQETFCNEKIRPYIDACWKGKIIHSLTKSNHARGVAILFSENMVCDIINVHTSDDGRKLMINISHNGTVFTLVNLYAPNDERERCNFYKNVSKWFNKNAMNVENSIVCGDMNCCLNDQDRKPATHLNDKSRSEFLNFISSNNLNDLFSYTKEKHNGYTYTDKRTGTKSRLDYIIASENITYNPIKLYKMQVFDRDHSAVVADFKISSNLRGPGYWKINNTLLVDGQYTEELKNVIKQTEVEYRELESKRLKWEIIKIKIKEFSLKHSQIKAKKRKKDLTDAQNKLDNLNDKIENTKNQEQKEYIALEKQKCEEIINKHYENKAKGYQTRARSKWIEEGEKSTRYFLGLEKKKQSSNVINKLKVKDYFIYKDKEILKEIAGYYEKLYSSNNIVTKDIINYLNNINGLKVLNDKEKKLCDEDITEEELIESVKNMKGNKSPGSDGLTPEFYKYFWSELKGSFIDMLKETYEYGELPKSMTKAILTLLFKKGDRYLLKNFRPISLTNYDYKILAFTLARRLQQVIRKLVHKDQSAYVKNRFIGCNVRILCDIIEHADLNNLPGLILCLDFEKAFDSLEWNFMFKILEKFNFGNKFTKWIKILYTNPNLVVKNNGWLSREVKMERGVRQGCPISALLFILATEVLSCVINQNENIKGYNIGNKDIKMVQHADDSTIILRDIQSIDQVISDVSEFTKMAGPKLNMEKTEGILIGSLRDNNYVHGNIIFNANPVKCLGIYIGNDVKKCEEMNWDKILVDFKNLLESWKKRKLTLYGKVQVVNSLAVSKLIYNFSTLCVPEHIIKNIQSNIYNFIWKKNDRIKRQTIIGKKKQGGIGVVDIESKIKSLKAAWVARMVNCDSSWKHIANMYAKKLAPDIHALLSMNFSKNDHVNIPKFYEDVITSFHKCKQYKNNNILSENDFLCEPIFLNRRYISKGKTLYFSNWIKSGLFWIKDLFDHEGNFISERDVLNKLSIKTNWLIEYATIKKVICKLANFINCKNAIYTRIIGRSLFYLNNKYVDVGEVKSKFYYEIFINKKFKRTYMESTWSKTFKIENTCRNWEIIYKSKIMDIQYKKLSEFNYKLIHNILPSGKLLCKWNKNVSRFCAFCGKEESVQHMLFDCDRIQDIWKLVGSILVMNVKWKHIVIGYLENNSNTCFRSLLFSIITYSIFCQWCIHSENDEQYKKVNILAEIKLLLTFYKNVFSNVKGFLYIEYLNMFTDALKNLQ